MQYVNVKIAKHHPSQWSLYKVPPLFAPFLCCDVIADSCCLVVILKQLTWFSLILNTDSLNTVNNAEKKIQSILE